MEVILQDAAYEGGGRVSHTHEDREKYYTVIFLCNIQEGLPWGFSGKESSCNARDASLILVLGRLENTENGKPFQYSCLENCLDRGACWATVHGVARVGHDLVTKL